MCSINWQSTSVSSVFHEPSTEDYAHLIDCLYQVDRRGKHLCLFYPSLELQFLWKQMYKKWPKPAIAQINEEGGTLVAIPADRDRWDDPDGFVENGKTRNVSSNLLPETFRNLWLNISSLSIPPERSSFWLSRVRLIPHSPYTTSFMRLTKAV